MNMLATLRRSGGIEALARKLDAPPPLAAAGTRILLPYIMRGFKLWLEEAGAGEAGLEALRAYFRPFGGGDLAAAVMYPQPTSAERGKAVLGDIAGSPEAVAAMLAEAQAASGIDSRVLVALFPLLAMLVGGYLAARLDGVTVAAKVGADQVLALLTLDEHGEPDDEAAQV